MFTIKVIYENGQEYGFTTNKYRVLHLEEGVTIDSDDELITLNENDTAYVINDNGATVSKIIGKQ